MNSQMSNSWLNRALVFTLLGCFAAFIPANAEDKPAASANVSGTYKWSYTPPDGGEARESVLKLKHEGDKLTGTYKGRGTEVPIEEGAIKDGVISFQVTRERDGQKSITKYSGKLDGDTIKGKIEGNFGGENRTRDWAAKREKDAAK